MKLVLQPKEKILYFSTEDYCFPDTDWLDYIANRLDYWMPQLISFLTRHTDSCRLDFMDGPYFVVLQWVNSEAIARFMKNGNQMCLDVTVDLRELAQSVVVCIRAWNRYLHLQGEESQYLRELKLLKQQLESIY
jgi:hypothetical protein